MERCCFAQLLKDVHSVSGRCFFAPLRKAIQYSVNVAKGWGCERAVWVSSCTILGVVQTARVSFALL